MLPFFVDASDFDPASRELIADTLEKCASKLVGPHYTSDFMTLVQGELNKDELRVDRDRMLDVIRQAVNVGYMQTSKRGSATMYTWVGP